LARGRRMASVLDSTYASFLDFLRDRFATTRDFWR
jgi:hypothetical protein